MDKLKVKEIEIKLVAFNIELFYAWKEHFEGIENISVLDGDILKFQADAIVSPANSFGYMDGGLDLKYSQYFGWDLETKLRNHLEKHYYGEIPVGNAVIIETGNAKIKYLISAPTMRVPMNVAETVNSYLAFKGILQAIENFNTNNQHQIKSLLCPGLGTGEGRMSYKNCAFQMMQAYRLCAYSEIETQGGLANASRNHIRLLNQEI